MAHCPKCNKDLHWYKYFTTNKWRGVTCDSCGATSFIVRNNILLNSLFILTIALCVIVDWVFKDFKTKIIVMLVYIILIFIIDNTIIWQGTKLKIKEE